MAIDHNVGGLNEYLVNITTSRGYNRLRYDAYRTLRRFNLIDEEKESFKFWLLKVCRNAYFDYLKKARRLAPVHDNMRGDDADLAEKVIEDEEYRALYRAIALLNDNYREVILLYYFDELSVSEIAGITGQTVQNVKVLMYRARMKLKEILED